MNREQIPTIAPVDEGDNEEFGCADEAMALLPESVKELEVGYVRRSKEFYCFYHQNVRMYFKIITPGEHFGKELFATIRTSPKPGMKSMAPRSQFALFTTIALGRPLTRRDRFTFRVFEGKTYRVSVRTVKTVKRNSKTITLDPALWYSVIDMLLEKTAGS